MFPEESALLAVERQRIIRETLENEGAVRNAELKEILRVSAVTIRSDLRELKSTGICRIIWGGAVYIKPVNNYAVFDPLQLAERSNLYAEEKRRIGCRAAQMVEVGQTIIVDAGSTTVELVRHLSQDMDYLRIVTPALNVATVALQFPQVELIMTGGILRHLTHSLIGPQVMRSLEIFNADWAFIATNGFSIDHGITTSNILEVEVKRMMFERATKVALLADSSKWGKSSALNVAQLQDIDVLITDTRFAEADAAILINLGIDVIRV